MKKTCRAAAVVGGLMVALVGTVGLAPAATAEYGTAPTGPVWVPDGPVHAVVTAGNRIYVGGSFTGGIAALDASSGARVPLADWNGTTNGDVRALAMSADGLHVLAGGAFTEADGVTHKKLASFSTADGSVDPRWKAAAGGAVRDIVVSGDTMYFGGAFLKHGGLAQRGLGAAVVSTGKPIASFTPSTDANVYALALAGGKLVFSGTFTHVTAPVTAAGAPVTSARNSMASVTLATGTLDPWNPARACTDCNVYWDLAVDGNTVFAASRNAGALSATDLTTGARRWTTIGANGDAQAVTVANGTVYVGGHFTGIKSQPRTILAAVSESTGALLPFAPRFVTTYPGIWALASTPTSLYAGGHFTGAGPPPKQHPYLAIFHS